MVTEALELYREGLPSRAISRVKGIGKSTVQNWVLKVSKTIVLEKPAVCGDIELDELQFFLGNRNKRKWLWLAVCRTSRKILGIRIGGRSKCDFVPLWKQLINIPCRSYCSDGYEVYNVLLPFQKHKYGKQHTFTVEGMMSVLRHFLARFRRKTRCYSRSLKMAEAAVLLFAANWNEKRNYS